MIQAATTLLQHGINPLPTDIDKRPLSRWNDLQHQLLTTDALPDMFERASAIATINGQVSGGLMVWTSKANLTVWTACSNLG